jgi:hypothetical protein
MAIRKPCRPTDEGGLFKQAGTMPQGYFGRIAKYTLAEKGGVLHYEAFCAVLLKIRTFHKKRQMSWN